MSAGEREKEKREREIRHLEEEHEEKYNIQMKETQDSRPVDRKIQ